jgi:hypothetical protein
MPKKQKLEDQQEQRNVLCLKLPSLEQRTWENKKSQKHFQPPKGKLE